MARNDIEMRITADSRAVAAGLKPMMTSLDQAQVAAQETEKSLSSIGTTPVKVNINDEAIAAARAEITRLRTQMREQLSTDVNADTSQAEKRIRDLQKSIKTLDAEKPVVDVVVNTTRVDTLRSTITGIQEAVSGGGGGGGLIGGLGLASRGISAVGGEAAAAAGPIGAVGTAMVVAGGAAFKLGQSAADAETSIAQLDALTSGMGFETFQMLQDFAAQTPFEMDEVVASTKRLVAAGVDLKDIPSTIGDLGEVAAATGVPLEQVSTVFAQMVSKGKASYEELQQLAEAGIPVWQTLADKLGLTVAQVQTLATEGKLSSDAIILLQKSLAATYSGAMVRQSKTFNGEMSTLHDTINQTGQAIGTTFLPAMKDIVEIATAALNPILKLTQGFADLNAQGEQKFGFNLLDVSPIFLGLDLLNGGLKDTEDQTDATTGSFAGLGLIGSQALQDVQDQIDQQNQALADSQKLAADLEQAFQDAVDAFQGIGAGVRARVDFIIDRDDLEDEIRKAVKGTEDQKPVTLPADLKIGQVSGLTDVQQDLVKNLSAFATQGLEEGARQADLAHSLGTSFDTEGFYRDLRKQLRPLVIEAGIDPKNINQFLNTVLGVPAPWQVQPEVTGVPAAQQAITNAFPPVQVPIDVRIPPKAREAMEASLGIGLGPDGTTATITTEIAGAEKSRSELNDVANPGGSHREAIIDIKLRRSSADDILSLPTTGGPAGATGDDRRTPVAPQREPRVQVLIDGEEIANHLKRRGRQLATTGGRRNP